MFVMYLLLRRAPIFLWIWLKSSVDMFNREVIGNILVLAKIKMLPFAWPGFTFL